MSPPNVLDDNLLKSVSSTLLSAKIPCVLWGNRLLTIYGVPSIVDSFQFVVPDQKIAAATSVLKSDKGLGLVDCKEPETCGMTIEPRSSPAPAAHVHLNASDTICLFAQSTTLPNIRDLPLKLPISNISTSDFILASDSCLPLKRRGRGRGRLSPSLGSLIIIPTAHHLTEAYIHLLVSSRGHRFEHFWMAMLTYIWEYVDNDGLLNHDLLGSRYRTFFQGLKTTLSTEALLDEFEAGEKRDGIKI